MLAEASQKYHGNGVSDELTNGVLAQETAGPGNPDVEAQPKPSPQQLPENPSGGQTPTAEANSGVSGGRPQHPRHDVGHTPHKAGGAAPYQAGDAALYQAGNAAPYQAGGPAPYQAGGPAPYQAGGAAP